MTGFDIALVSSRIRLCGLVLLACVRHPCFRWDISAKMIFDDYIDLAEYHEPDFK